MSDRVTGLGQTIADYEMMNGEVYLGDIIAQIKRVYEGTNTNTVELYDLEIEDGVLTHSDLGQMVKLEDDDYEKLCKVVGIPSKYIMKLNRNMRKMNLEYWFEEMGENEVTITYRPDQIVEIKDRDEIKPLDVLEIVRGVIPKAKIFKVTNQTNSQIYDIYDEALEYRTAKDIYCSGLRIVLRSGLNAPDISPIFINKGSCGIIECSTYLEKMIIKSLTYKDILRVIQERVENCVEASPMLFDALYRMCVDEVDQPHRRIALYCREHAVPERIKAYALQRFDEANLPVTTYEDIICLFSVIGYVEEVKQASERKMQQLAGYIIVKAKGEKRCSHCDATLIDD